MQFDLNVVGSVVWKFVLDAVVKVIKLTPRWKQDILPELATAWALHSQEVPEVEDSNVEMLYNNFHQAIKGQVHKSTSCKEVLQRIDEYNEDELIANGILSLRALKVSLELIPQGRVVRQPQINLVQARS